MSKTDQIASLSKLSNVHLPLRETGSQTAGPYVHIGCLPNMAGIDGIYPNDLVSNGAISPKNSISISGQVFDGNGAACKDIMLEFWQADESGSFNPGIWNRTGTDLDTGEFNFSTLMPRTLSDNDSSNLAPFISVWIVARGINLGLQTRIYFPDFERENARDPHLALVPKNRRDTLMATKCDHENAYRFDIKLQGEGETVFFET